MTLREALGLFEEELARVSPLAASRLGPGLPPEETAASLQRLGLVAPNDVLDWFSWHNGSMTSDDPLWVSVWIGPSLSAASLELLAQDYVEWMTFLRENLPQEYDHEHGWFPLIATDSGDSIVVNCNGEPQVPVQCARRSPDSGLWTRTLTLEECIRYWADAIANGRWTCDETERNYPYWTVRPDRGPSLPSHVKFTGLII